VLFLSAGLFGQVRERETAETREEKVRDLLEKFNQAYQQKNVESLATFVAPDMTGFAGGKKFGSWEEYRDNFLYPTFSRSMPPSTWDIEKIVTAPEMAWAYTKTSYKARRQGQQVEADLYQAFVLQKLAAGGTSKSKPTSSAPADWKIVLIDYSFHAAPLNQAAQPNSEPQAPGTQPHL
jgi:ketosteroid isomerase-like protein